MKNKKKLVILPLKLANIVIAAVLKTIFIDIFLNFKQSWIYTFNPEERNKMKRKLEAEKLAKVLDDRLKTVERLLYSVFEDPSYTKSDKGKYDVKQLKKEVK
ncbi:MAG: hypothetical protein KKA79_04155 [Nanoarchaeota archaeon]|nr:hypothetical protein [Nanoarchaeota archaeon]